MCVWRGVKTWKTYLKAYTCAISMEGQDMVNVKHKRVRSGGSRYVKRTLTLAIPHQTQTEMRGGKGGGSEVNEEIDPTRLPRFDPQNLSTAHRVRWTHATPMGHIAQHFTGYTGWLKKPLDSTLEIYFWDWVYQVKDWCLSVYAYFSYHFCRKYLYCLFHFKSSGFFNHPV